MIPFLYEHNETEFTSAGIGSLGDCIDCVVTEEINGIFECEFEYPMTGRNFNKILEGRYIMAAHDNTGNLQPFEIYKRSAPIDGKVKFYAHHISYKLNKAVQKSLYGYTLQDAFRALGRNAVGGDNFTFVANEDMGTGPYILVGPKSIKAAMQGDKDSLVGTYGGELIFDKYTVTWVKRRGRSTGVEIRYGKNLTDINQEYDTSETYNAVVPFWLYKASNTEWQIVWMSYTGDDNLTKDPDAELLAVPMDLTDQFETTPTPEQLKAKAQEIFDGMEPRIPKESIVIDFVQLWQTEEYKDYAALEEIVLGDDVNVYYPALGVTAERQRAVKVVYDTLRDRYKEMTLNQLPDTLLDVTQSQIDSNAGSIIGSAVSTTSGIIQGRSGGNIAFQYNSAGQPVALYVMDSAEMSQAANVLKLDATGLSHSPNGIGGAYTTIIGIDGTIA